MHPENGELSVSLKEKSSVVEIEVHDTGNGIPENEQSLIFERFFRGENKKLKVRGLGLGLPFSRMLVKAHGGELNLVKSSPFRYDFQTRFTM